MHLKSLLLVLLISSQSLLFAGPWNKKKGHGYSQFSFTYLQYSKLLNGYDNPIDLKRNINDFTYQLYLEYGLSDKLDLLVNLPYKAVSSSSSLNQTGNDPYPNDTLDQGKLNAFSNMSFALKYTFFEKKYALAAQLAASNKMHSYEAESGLRVGYDAFLIRPSILLGRGWEKLYFQMDVGLQLNNNKYAQNIVGSIEVGRKYFEGKTLLMIRSDTKIPFTEGTFDEGNSVQTGLYRDNSSFISFGFKGIRTIYPNFYTNLGIYGSIFSENEGVGVTISFGLAYEW